MKCILVFVALIGMEVASSCKPKATAVVEKEYYYYPATNMYYDVAGKKFFFSLDGAASWDSLDATAYQADTSNLGVKQVIYARDSVWVNNQAHRTAYGGKLYNVVDDDDTTAVTGDTIITEKAKRKPAAPKVEVKEEKKKTGVGRFLQKIFGKKKNKGDDTKKKD